MLSKEAKRYGSKLCFVYACICSQSSYRHHGSAAWATRTSMMGCMAALIGVVAHHPTTERARWAPGGVLTPTTRPRFPAHVRECEAGREGLTSEG